MSASPSVRHGALHDATQFECTCQCAPSCTQNMCLAGCSMGLRAASKRRAVRAPCTCSVQASCEMPARIALDTVCRTHAPRPRCPRASTQPVHANPRCTRVLEGSSYLGLQFTGGPCSAGATALRTDDAPGSLRLWALVEDPIASGAGCPACPSYVVPANASSKGWWSRLDCASCFLHALASARRSSWFPFLPPALAQSPGIALGLSRAVHTGLVIYMIMTAVRAQRVSKVESTRPTSGLFQAGQLRRSHPWLRTCQDERLRVA